METHAVFDIQGYIKSMTDAGIEPRSAEAIAHGQIAYLNATVATKKDIEELRAATQRDIERSKNDLTWRVIGLFIVFSGIIVTGFFAALQMYLPLK